MTPLRPSKGEPIDWNDVRRRLAERQRALLQAFAGEGPWADALLDRRTENLSRLAIPGDGERETGRLLVASGTRLRYGIPLERLARVMPVPQVAPVPGAPPELLGLIAVFGRVMRLFDADALCGEPAEADRGFGYAAVLRGGVRPVALRFLALEDAVPEPAPTAEDGGVDARPCPLISMVTPARIAVLDVPALFTSLDINPISEGPAEP